MNRQFTNVALDFNIHWNVSAIILHCFIIGQKFKPRLNGHRKLGG